MAVATDPLVRHSHGSPVSVPHTPGSAVTAGDVVVVGNITAIAQDDIAASRLGDLYVAGVVTVTGDAAIDAGKRVYWDATNSKVTETEGANKVFGITIAAFSADQDRQEVLHWPDFTLAAGVLMDLDGLADGLVLDTDGDTTISAPTDDQIDFEIAGADDFTMTANAFNVLAGSKIGGAGSTFGVFAPAAAQQALSGAGAVNITTYYTAVTNTGADALTLVDGAVIGQLKKVQMIVDPGTDSTLTPSNLSGGTTIVFADVGDYCLLLWDGTNWVAIELGNDADGATAPVLA